MGFMFGVVFGMVLANIRSFNSFLDGCTGLLDIEDVRMSHLRVALVRDEGICYPIGALIGGIGACKNTIHQHLQNWN